MATTATATPALPAGTAQVAQTGKPAAPVSTLPVDHPAAAHALRDSTAVRLLAAVSHAEPDGMASVGQPAARARVRVRQGSTVCQAPLAARCAQLDSTVIRQRCPRLSARVHAMRVRSST